MPGPPFNVGLFRLPKRAVSQKLPSYMEIVSYNHEIRMRIPKKKKNNQDDSFGKYPAGFLLDRGSTGRSESSVFFG